MSASLPDLGALEFHILVAVCSDSQLTMSLVVMVGGLSFPKCTVALGVDRLHIKCLQKRLVLK